MLLLSFGHELGIELSFPLKYRPDSCDMKSTRNHKRSGKVLFENKTNQKTYRLYNRGNT